MIDPWNICMICKEAYHWGKQDQSNSKLRYLNRHRMQWWKQATQVALGTTLAWARTIAVTSLKELRVLIGAKHSPLAWRTVLGIEITALEQSKPELYRCSCVAVWSTEDNVQPEVLIAATTSITLVIGCLQTCSIKWNHLLHRAEKLSSHASPGTLLSARWPDGSWTASSPHCRYSW